MNEPKRRGRPPKALAESMVSAQYVADKAARVLGPDNEITQHFAAQAYAKRVWDGQGNTIPRVERLRRVAKALEGQGLSMEGVSL